MANKDTESIDRLFLELSQFTQATTAKELRLQDKLQRIRAIALEETGSCGDALVKIVAIVDSWS